jgi:DNA repair protein RecO (recombination protein O)
MDWEAPGVVLQARPYGEGDAIAAVMTEEHGLSRGLARGGGARGGAAVWQPGNLVQVRWVARLADQLGSFSAELVHSGAAQVMDDAVALAILASACALAEGGLPEREPHPLVFKGLIDLIARVPLGTDLLRDYVRWEAVLLTELGYGLDLSACAVTGQTSGLCFVSPRTGRAVTREAAGGWASRLLRLPGFLAGGNSAELTDIEDGLRLTGHFLARDAFGTRHKPLPTARQMLYDRVAALASEGR